MQYVIFYKEPYIIFIMLDMKILFKCIVINKPPLDNDRPNYFASSCKEF